MENECQKFKLCKSILKDHGLNIVTYKMGDCERWRVSKCEDYFESDGLVTLYSLHELLLWVCGFDEGSRRK